MLSLCLENAELKEQMGEAMSDGWEIEEDKEKGEAMVETVVAKGVLNHTKLDQPYSSTLPWSFYHLSSAPGCSGTRSLINWPQATCSPTKVVMPFIPGPQETQSGDVGGASYSTIL